MTEEKDIVSQVLAAKESAQAADALIEQYLPFIRSESAKHLGRFPGQEEDGLSIAMFAFYEAIHSYEPGRGAFLKLAARAIRNRLIDAHRKQARHRGHLSLDMPATADSDRTLAEQIADERMSLDARDDRRDAQAEIAHFSRQLSDFGLSLSDVADNCPQQERTRKSCMRVLAYARQEPALLQQLVRTGKLPMGELAAGAGVEKKTLERHRKYLVAVLLAYTNGFEIIRGHLQQLRGKEEADL